MKLTAFRCCCIEIDTVFAKDDSITLCGVGSSAAAFIVLHLQYMGADSAPYSHQNSEELKYMARRCGNCWNASTS